jgi:hypothetical protein
MKILFCILEILVCQWVFAQSPSLSINVLMDSAKAQFTWYKIEMKICEPQKMTKRGDWFSHDTSAIDFASLKAEDITCGEYFTSNEGLIQLSGEKKEKTFNTYEYSGQLFAWGKIFVFKIANWSSRAWWPEMYVILPVKYKSFVTSIYLTGIEFQSGKVIFISDLHASYDKKGLMINQSLANEKTVEVKDFPLKNLLENR